MECPGQEVIERYVLDELESKETVQFEAHLRECNTCQSRVEEARDNEKLLAQLQTWAAKTSPAASVLAEDAMTIDDAQKYLDDKYDKYRVVHKAGEGASGQVFQAIDTVLDRRVAVKFLRKKWLSEDISSEPWREARLMSQLNDPHVVQIYDVGTVADYQFIIMEWVDGMPITDAWKDLPLQQRLRVYLLVLEAIAAAHRKGIVHRDIKPSNILVTSNQHPKILDFGIALDLKAVQEQKDQAYLYRGTPAYSAPEQITVPVKVSSGTDVFALGTLLYELLTNSLPFPQTDSTALFEAIRHQHPELPRAIEEKVPIPLQHICLKALEKNLATRYADASALGDEIGRYLRGERVWSRASFLSDKINQEVFLHRQKLRVWRDNELVTEGEYDRLERIYHRLVAPPDLSIIEARQLSLSQVCLYLGGWICLLGTCVLFYVWNDISPYGRPAPVLFATVVTMTLGAVFWRRRDSRLAVGFLATANLLVPVAIVSILAHGNIFDSRNPAHQWGHESVTEYIDDYYEGLAQENEAEDAEIQSWLYVGNIQLCLGAACWLIFSLLFLGVTRSSIFVVLGIVGFLCLLTLIYIKQGMIATPWNPDIIAGRYLFPGITFFIVGIILDRRGHVHYAGPLSVSGMLLIVGPLSIIAYSPNTLFGWLGTIPEFLKNTTYDDSELTTEAMYLSFTLNGLIYLALASLCRSMGTLLQRRLSQVFNWLGPLHILSALRMLDGEDFYGDDIQHRLLYRFLLPLASLAFVFGSVARQMKSFFFSGLMGIAVAIRTFTVEHFSDAFAWPICLVLIGTSWMLLSWAVPRWRAQMILRNHEQQM